MTDSIETKQDSEDATLLGRRRFLNDEDQGLFRAALDGQHRVEVEIGSGKGLFLIQATQSNPDVLFLGIELAAKYAALAQSRLEQLGIKNGRCFCGDGVAIMADEVPDNRLDAVHVYFPDPWWKARHKKRRVLNEKMLVAIERTLKPGGIFHFWTDVVDYYDSTLELVSQVSTLEGPLYVDEPESKHDMDYRTHFERRTRLNGLPVYRCQYRKKWTDAITPFVYIS